jgi:hypothetical protein
MMTTISDENETNIRAKFEEKFTLASSRSILFDDEWHQQLPCEEKRTDEKFG